jgi:hypothetical protein
MNRSLWLARALAVLVLITLIAYWGVVRLLAAAPLSVGGLVTLGYLALAIATLSGLLRRRIWGFYALYALLVFGTVTLGISFIPLRLSFVPLRQRWIGLTVLNAVVFALGALGHYWFRRDGHHAPSGAA